jgi:hypothetical protein
MKKFIALIFVVFFHTNLFSNNIYYSILGGRNSGEHIFETGNKHPNLSGIRGGSRITYNRNFNYGGLGFLYHTNQLQLTGTFRSTGWYINPGTSRDEDFVMGDISSEKGSKVDIRKGNVYDTAHTYTGTRNFADAMAKTSMSEYSANLKVKYFTNATGDAYDMSSSMFFSFGTRYTYFKYYLYDVMQFISSRPIFYGPIGNGLSYSYNTLEVPLGIGYRKNLVENLSIELSLDIFLAYNRQRDFHVQRALNFIGYALGSGYIGSINLTYLTEYGMIGVGLNFHRQFTEGRFKTKGGLSESDIFSNYIGHFRSYVNTKQANLEFSFIKRLNIF